MTDDMFKADSYPFTVTVTKISDNEFHAVMESPGAPVPSPPVKGTTAAEALGRVAAMLLKLQIATDLVLAQNE